VGYRRRWEHEGEGIKARTRAVAEHPREKRGIKKLFFHYVAKQGLKTVMEQFKMF